METRKPLFSGLTGFALVWVGQLISLFGSFMTGFAIPIWVYQQTESATSLALMGVLFTTPMLVISPLAGALVDRSNRKLMMMLSDLSAGVVTIVYFLLFSQGRLEIWHLYIGSAIQGTFQAFQWPAYSAAISTMLPKEQYGRANGMMSLLEIGPAILAPMMAAALLGSIGLRGIFLIDIVTFSFAIGALLLVHVPQPVRTVEGQKSQGNLLSEALYGFRYILARPSLLGLQLIFLFANFFHGTSFAVFPAMILARTGSDAQTMAIVNVVGAFGGLAGGLLMSVWGGSKRKVHGVLGGWILTGLLGSVLVGLNGLPFWLAGAFLGAVFGPIINASNQAIWQTKVAPDIQGRVFSIRRLIAWFVQPISGLLAGPLADRLLEPAMRASDSALSQSFGWLVGVGPGAGMGLMFVFAGLGAALVGLAGYFIPVVRDAETLLPDHDALEKV